MKVIQNMANVIGLVIGRVVEEPVFAPFQPVIEVGEHFQHLVLDQSVALQFMPDFLGHMREKNSKVVAFGQVFGLDEAEGRRRVQARDAPEIENQIFERRFLRSG